MCTVRQVSASAHDGSSVHILWSCWMDCGKRLIERPVLDFSFPRSRLPQEIEKFCASAPGIPHPILRCLLMYSLWALAWPVSPQRSNLHELECGWRFSKLATESADASL